MQQINDWLQSATKQLKASHIDSASLDADLILCHVMGKTRSYLRSHSNDRLSYLKMIKADVLLNRRKKRVPIAYITHQKEFFGRNFSVNKHTLIPRPESEDIIEILNKILPNSTFHLPTSNLLDIGTGSGCLGITAKLEFPEINVTLSDISPRALKVASKNAKKLSADITVQRSDLLDSITTTPNIILANLPYVDRSWQTSPEIDYEPHSALFASDGGKELIQKLILQASTVQNKNDIIVFEADPEQHEDLIQFAKDFNYISTTKNGYAVLLTKN